MPISLRLAALLAAGAAAGLHLPPGSWRGLSWLAVAAGLMAWRARRLGLHGPDAALLAVAILAAAAGRAVSVTAQAERPALVEWFDATTMGASGGRRPATDVPVRVRGRLIHDAARSPFGARMTLAVSHVEADGRWSPARGGLAVSVAGALVDDITSWRAGRQLVLPVTIRRPAQYRNRGLPDQSQVLARRGTPLVGSTKSGLLVEVWAAGAWWDERAADVRARVRAAMRAYVAPHDGTSAAVGTAILIGDRAQLAPAVERQLQEAGTYHVVAISGGNIALLTGAVLAMLWCLGIRFAPAAAVTTVLLLVHAWVIGAGPSVARATLMAAIYLLLRLVDHRTAPMHAVAVAAGAMLAINPLEIAGAGFWLTFGATGALLMAAARCRRPAPESWLAPVAGVLVASVAVELLLMPVSAYVFERVTLAGLVLNLVAVPAMGVVQAAASACVAADAAGLPAFASLSGHATHLAARALLWSSGLVAVVPWATWRVPPPAFSTLAIYYTVVAAWWWASAPPVDDPARRRVSRCAAAVALGLWSWMATAPATWLTRGDGLLHLTAMDVGQGDALLVTLPEGRTILVDTGGLGSGTFDIGDRILGPAIRARGLRRLDYLAITHGDLDHVGGAAAVLRDFRPREVWAGVPVSGHAPLVRLHDDARAAGTPWRWLQRGDRLELNGIDVRVHHPPLPEWERQRVRNDDSVVLELRHGAVSIWLMGDVSRAVESEVLAFADPARINVVKVAHHGSLTSSGAPWVSRLRPAAALISAGSGNLFGHPAPAVVQRYADEGAAVFRTDQDGQLDLRTNGHYVDVTTFTGRRWRLR